MALEKLQPEKENQNTRKKIESEKVKTEMKKWEEGKAHTHTSEKFEARVK